MLINVNTERGHKHVKPLLHDSRPSKDIKHK